MPTKKKIITADSILISENEFTKVFKYKDIDLFVSKAIDEDTTPAIHFLTCSIPFITEFNIEKVQYPIPFISEEKRDEQFDTFDAKIFIKNLIDYIKKIKQESEKKN